MFSKALFSASASSSPLSFTATGILNSLEPLFMLLAIHIPYCLRDISIVSSSGLCNSTLFELRLTSIISASAFTVTSLSSSCALNTAPVCSSISAIISYIIIELTPSSIIVSAMEILLLPIAFSSSEATSFSVVVTGSSVGLSLRCCSAFSLSSFLSILPLLLRIQLSVNRNLSGII